MTPRLTAARARSIRAGIRLARYHRALGGIDPSASFDFYGRLFARAYLRTKLADGNRARAALDALAVRRERER